MNDAMYAPVSNASVASVVFAALSVAGFVVPLFAVFALPACVFGVIALRGTSKYGLRGRTLAIVTVPASLTIAIGTPFVELALYRSEAPSGYARVNFSRDLDEHVGQPICIKGFGLLASAEGVDRFALTSNGSNFRGAPIIVVQLANGNLWEWTANGIAVSGTLELHPSRDDVDDSPRYVLRNAIVRPSRTLFQQSARTAERC